MSLILYMVLTMVLYTLHGTKNANHISAHQYSRRVCSPRDVIRLTYDELKRESVNSEIRVEPLYDDHHDDIYCIWRQLCSERQVSEQGEPMVLWNCLP